MCSIVTQALGELSPSYLSVTEVSCARLQRRLLGANRYWHRHVKQEKKNQHGRCRWEAQCYEIRCRKSTTEHVRTSSWLSLRRLSNEDVFLKHLGYFDTEKAAATAYDAAFRARDVANPLTGSHFVNSELPVQLVKFFEVVVVSERFSHSTQIQRLAIVYEALLASSELTRDGIEAEEQGGEGSALTPAIRHVKGFTWVSENVLNLPLWRFLTPHFTIRAMTPTQWAASGRREGLELSHTERFGLSHMLNDRTLGVGSTAVPAYHDLAQLVASNQETADVSSVLPHFYHGLPDELKRMIAEEQAKANPALREEAASSSAAVSGMITKLAKNTEDAFVRNYLKRRREYSRAAVTLQLVFLSNMQSKTLKHLRRRHLGAITLQRLYRAHRRRQFVALYFRVATCASLLIQSVYRSHVSRCQTRRLRQQMEQAALTIQRLYRGFRARQFFRWAWRMQAGAITSERLVRGFMARRRVQRIRRAKFKATVVIPACVAIQRVWRGHRDRLEVREKRRVREQLLILLPAAMRIESLARGFLARRLANRYRRANQACRLIQRVWKRYRYSQKWWAMVVFRQQNCMASRIGALGRGYIARKFVARERRRRYFVDVVEPAALDIQRVYRGYIVRRRVEAASDRVEAAITLQQMWRQRSNIKKIQAKLIGFRESIRYASASRIQRAYQCYKARRQLLYLRLARQGTCGKAVVVVQSAWRSYCSRKVLKQFRFCSMIERKAEALTKAKDEREMIEFDLFDARADLKRIIRYKAKALRRIKELKAMRIEWERRQPVVEKELSQLTEEDVDRGWGEAFVTEKHILHYSLELSVEDILSRREQVREYEIEIEDLRLEIEDLERDLEESVLSETGELESYREFEIAHALRMFQEERDRRVRLQRIRWRVKNVRKNVIMRDRADLSSIEKQFLASRSADELGALAFEKKQQIEQKLQQAIAGAVDSRTKRTAEAIEMRRDAVVLDGFNSAIQRMGDITKEFSFHYRVPKVDLREVVNSPMCQECGRITCDCEAQRAESEESAKVTTSDQPQGFVAKSRVRNRLARRWRYQDG